MHFFCQWYTFFTLLFNVSDPAKKNSSGMAYNKSPTRPPNYATLDSRVFKNFILTVELFTKTLRIFETCVLVNNSLREKLVSSSPIIINIITFDEKFKVTWVPLFIPDFNLLSCELDSFTFKVLY